jgi:hypothetical protein
MRIEHPQTPCTARHFPSASAVARLDLATWNTCAPVGSWQEGIFFLRKNQRIEVQTAEGARSNWKLANERVLIFVTGIFLGNKRRLKCRFPREQGNMKSAY